MIPHKIPFESTTVVSLNVSMKEVIITMTAKKLGMTTVVDSNGILCGIITDGDLRRLLNKEGNPFNQIASDVMSRTPKTIGAQILATKAVQIMEEHSITSLVVVQKDQQVIGIIHLHELLKSGIV